MELRHTFEIEVAAEPEAVWRALTDPDLTERYYFACRLESTLEPGSPYRYVGGGSPATEGTLVAVQPPRRLEMTARYLFDPRASAEAPHRELWEIEPLGEGRCLVRLTCDGYEGENASFKMAPNGLPPVLQGLKSVVEPGALPSRLERIAPPEVRALTPELLDDYLAFFDRDAFRDNPAWAACYCTAYHHEGEESHDAAANRALAAELVARGRMQGFLAYVDGRPVGWCNAAPRPSLVGLDREPVLRVDEPERVGAIVCFVIASPYRRHGVARALLDAAVAGFAEQGLTYAEAYPSKKSRTDAEAFRGPLALYLEAGFETYRDLGRGAIVRKQL